MGPGGEFEATAARTAFQTQSPDSPNHYKERKISTNRGKVGKEASPVPSRASVLWVVVVAACLAVSPSAQATAIPYIYTFDEFLEFSGAVPPEGDLPWLIATFDDHGTTGSVDVTLEATNLTDAEFTFEWVLNLNPALDPTLLVFSEEPKTKIGEFTDPTISTGIDTFQADGDGFFDIQFMFSSADGGDKRFGAGEAVEYTIEGPDLTAYSFAFLSEQGGGQGSYLMGAHIGGIGPTDDGSGWVGAVPEPATFSLVLLGGLLIRRPRR